MHCHVCTLHYLCCNADRPSLQTRGLYGAWRCISPLLQLSFVFHKFRQIIIEFVFLGLLFIKWPASKVSNWLIMRFLPGCTNPYSRIVSYHIISYHTLYHISYLYMIWVSIVRSHNLHPMNPMYAFYIEKKMFMKSRCVESRVLWQHALRSVEHISMAMQYSRRTSEPILPPGGRHIVEGGQTHAAQGRCRGLWRAFRRERHTRWALWANGAQPAQILWPIPYIKR